LKNVKKPLIRKISIDLQSRDAVRTGALHNSPKSANCLMAEIALNIFYRKYAYATLFKNASL
jgi:hypothetical protein